MDYPSIIGEYFPYYAKNSTWKYLHEYIDAHSQRLIDEYSGDIVQSISRPQSQYLNITFSDQRIYKRIFQKIIHEGGESEMNYIKRFQNAKAS